MTRTHRVVIFGDSHAQPLVEALQTWCFRDEAYPDGLAAEMVDCGLIAQDLLMETKDRGDMFNPLLQRALEKYGLMNRIVGGYLPGDAHVGLLFGYADVHMMGLVKLFFEDFDGGLLQDGPAAPTGVADYAMLRELIRRRLNKVEKSLALLRAAGYSVFLLSAPPPASDADLRRHQPVSDPPPSGARRAVWSAIQEVMAELAPRYGAVLLTDQSRFMDADGFLSPQYVGDGIHANAEHGLAYLTDVVRGLGLALTPSARHGAAEPEPEPTEVEPAPLPAATRGWRTAWRRR